jgi:hypothetical protein
MTLQCDPVVIEFARPPIEAAVYRHSGPVPIAAARARIVLSRFAYNRPAPCFQRLQSLSPLTFKWSSSLPTEGNRKLQTFFPEHGHETRPPGPPQQGIGIGRHLAAGNGGIEHDRAPP